MSAKAMQDGRFFDAAMNALILYDQFDLATKARFMLERASGRTAESIHWHVKLWRADMLNLPPVAAQALTDAVDAHLVVLAMRQSQPLPFHLVGWLEEWAGRRRVLDAAVATFGEINAGALPPAVTPELSRFARRHRLSFISGGSEPAGAEQTEFA